VDEGILLRAYRRSDDIMRYYLRCHKACRAPFVMNTRRGNVGDVHWTLSCAPSNRVTPGLHRRPLCGTVGVVT